MKREPGFYWIMFYFSWSVAFYDGCGKWKVINSEERYTDDEFEKIDENRLTHE